VLSRQESIALLGRVLGDRANAEPAAVAALAELCGDLPLALRIAAANLASRPPQPIADYVAMLRDDDRLAALAVPGDPDNAVLASFDLSHCGLPPAARRTFRLLSVVPGPDVTPPAAAAVAGTTVDEPVMSLLKLHDLRKRRDKAVRPSRAPGAVLRTSDRDWSTVDHRSGSTVELGRSAWWCVDRRAEHVRCHIGLPGSR
jgi:hypothetical protein